MEPEAEDQIVYQECILRDGVRYCADVAALPEGAAAPIDAASTGEADAGVVETATSGLLSWIDPILADPIAWAQTNLLNADVLIPLGLQIAAIVGCMLLGAIFAAPLRRVVRNGQLRLPENVQQALGEMPSRVVRPAITLLLFYVAQILLQGAGYDATLVRVAFSLSVAFLIITLAGAFLPEALRKPALYRHCS